MLKQQQIQSTELSFLHPNTTILENSSNSLSKNFKQRINRLKAKGKPGLLIPQNTLSSLSPIQNIIQNMQSIKTDRENDKQNRKCTLNGNKIERDDEKTVNQNKVIDMKVTYRKQALQFKKKPLKPVQDNSKYQQKSQQKRKMGKFNLQIFQNITLQQRKCSLQDYRTKLYEVNKENIRSNHFQIEDILINNVKSPLNSERCSKIVCKTARFAKAKTTINVRECSSKSGSEHHSVGWKIGGEKPKIQKIENGNKLTKTQSLNYRTK